MAHLTASPSARLLSNLRDLQLDDELDWPDIAVDTFAASDPIQNQKSRVRKAEWVLYHLFMLWDPHCANNGLEPYFPALEPRQSIELRTGLFQQLDGLKKQGVLSKDLILRKTMLDDCKGPKFQELLSSFSTSVILKLLSDDTRDGSLAKGLLLSEVLADLTGTQTLNAAYRASLTSNLRERANLNRRWLKFGRILRAKDSELGQRKARLEDDIGLQTEKRIPKRTIERLRKHIDTNWTGSQDWVDILLRSDQHRPQNQLLERPFAEIWKHACNDTLYSVRPEGCGSLLQDLERRLQEQNCRLENWRAICQDLNHPTQTSISQGSAEKTKSQEPCAQPVTPHASVTLSYSHKGAPGPRTPRANFHGGFETETPLHTQSKVEPLLKSSSPIRMTTDAMITKAFHEAERRRVPVTPDISRAATKKNREHPYNEARSPQKEHTSLVIDRRGLDSYEDDESFEEIDLPHTDLVALTVGVQSSPRKPVLSLAERTQMSLTNLSPSKKSFEPRSPAPRLHSPERLLQRTASSEADPYGSLAERTAHSIATLTAKKQLRVRSSKPTNQVDPREKSQAPTETQGVWYMEETLEDGNVDEETIFMSRPRVAHSPPLTPAGNGRGTEHIMALSDNNGDDFRDNRDVA